ncbi:MAG: hypothetical protein RCG15_03815 [Candidatus Rickettsia vulgarisii]
MIKLEEEFENKDYTLYPNQFVNIKLLVDNLENMVVVPTNAVQHGPSGDFVFY